MSTTETIERRQAGMGVLARAGAEDLAAHWAAWAGQPSYAVLRGPEVGQVMVRGRAGGGGQAFNLGEATVTRATVRLATGEIGHSYCLGRDTQKALTCAVFDALWQREPERVEAAVIAPLRTAQQARDRQRREETAATRVNFFTMVRGEDL